MPGSGYWGRTKPPVGVQLDVAHPLTNGMLAAFVLPERNGSRVTSSRGGQVGSLKGTASWSSGNRGSGVLVPGTTTNFVDCGSWPAINNLGAGAFSVFALCRRDATPGNETVLSKSSGASANGWYLLWTPSTTLRLDVKHATTSASARTTAGVGTTGEYAIAASQDINFVPRLYVNGAEVTYSTQTTGVGASSSEGTASLALGQLTDNFWPFNGLIYCAYVWNRAISPAEVASLYAAPYQMFAPPVWRRYFIPQAGATSAVHDTATRFALAAQTLRDTSSRFRLLANATRDTAARFKFQSATVWRDSSSRVRLQAQAVRDAATRFRLQSPVQWRDLSTRFRLAIPSVWRDSASRLRLQSPARLRDSTTRFRLQSIALWRNQATRFRLAVATLRDSTVRFRLSSPNRFRDTLFRFHLAAAGVPVTPAKHTVSDAALFIHTVSDTAR